MTVPIRSSRPIFTSHISTYYHPPSPSTPFPTAPRLPSFYNFAIQAIPRTHTTNEPPRIFPQHIHQQLLRSLQTKPAPSLPNPFSSAPHHLYAPRLNILTHIHNNYHPTPSPHNIHLPLDLPAPLMPHMHTPSARYAPAAGDVFPRVRRRGSSTN